MYWCIWLLLGLFITVYPSSLINFDICDNINNTDAILEQLQDLSTSTSTHRHTEKYPKAVVEGENKSLVVIVTYYTANIIKYASYSMFINYIWIQYANQMDTSHTYEYRIINESIYL